MICCLPRASRVREQYHAARVAVDTVIVSSSVSLTTTEYVTGAHTTVDSARVTSAVRHVGGIPPCQRRTHIKGPPSPDHEQTLLECVADSIQNTNVYIYIYIYICIYIEMSYQDSNHL